MACVLTLILPTWRAPNNASKWQMGFNLAFKGLKYTRLSNFIKIRPVWTDRQTDIRKLLAAFRNFAKEPKKKVKVSLSML
jgi:hypothetical protein